MVRRRAIIAGEPGAHMRDLRRLSDAGRTRTTAGHGASVTHVGLLCSPRTGARYVVASFGPGAHQPGDTMAIGRASRFGPRLRETLARITEEAAHLLDVEGVGLRLVEGDELIRVAAYGPEGGVMARERLRLGESLSRLTPRCVGRSSGDPSRGHAASRAVRSISATGLLSESPSGWARSFLRQWRQLARQAQRVEELRLHEAGHLVDAPPDIV